MNSLLEKAKAVGADAILLKGAESSTNYLVGTSKTVLRGSAYKSVK